MNAAEKVLKAAKAASFKLKLLPSSSKNQVLRSLAKVLGERTEYILKANAKDLRAFKRSPKYSEALADRLVLNESRIKGMIESLDAVASMPDPIGQITGEKALATGLVLKQRRDPFGVIFFIFEARPNVIAEAFSLAFKSGNVILFKNGREAAHSAKALYGLIGEVLRRHNVDENCAVGFANQQRAETTWLMKQEKWIDLVIPRGGDKLIESVKQNSRIPVIQNDRGLCHLYVDKEAELKMALKILVNGKTQRPSVCNALETLLVHQQVAREFLPMAQVALKEFDLRWWACELSRQILKRDENVRPATAKSFDREYLSLDLNCRVVTDLDQALEHISLHGSKHSEAIVTNNPATARRFQNEVDAAVAYWNASTRFTDGFQFGLGGEIGISTQKLHVRGPVGLEALTTLRWIVDGSGQVRK